MTLPRQQCQDRAVYSLMTAGLQKLDLAHAFTPHQEVLDQLTSLTRLTALYLGHGELFPC